MSSDKKKVRVRLVDLYYFWLQRVGNEAIVLFDEFLIQIRHVSKLPVVLSSTYFNVSAALMTPSKWKLGFVFDFFKLVLGLPLLLILFGVISLVVAAAGTVAAFAGFRNQEEYSFKEKMFGWILPILFIVFAPSILSDVSLQKVGHVLIFTILMIGVDFLFGRCGIPPFGHAAFVLIGAYFTAWFVGGAFGFSVPFGLSIILAGFCGGLIGLLLALPAVRVKDVHLSIVTLSFGTMLPLLLKSKYLAELSGVKDGGVQVKALALPSFLGGMRLEAYKFYVVAIFFICLLTFAYNLIRHSQIGRAFQTIKWDVEIAGSLGVPVFKFKLLAFALSAFYTSCAGGLLAVYTSFISPESYTMHDSINYNIALMFGGLNSLLGASIGGIFLTMEPELAFKIGLFIPKAQQFLYAITGAMMIFLLYFAPHGVAGVIVSTLRKKFGSKVQRGSNYKAPPPDYDLLAARKLPRTSRYLEGPKHD